MHSPTDTKPRWERRKDARPQELLAAALDLFVSRGYAATRLEDVARSAGVSKGTLYLYFANKEELFKAVVRDAIVQPIGEAETDYAALDGHSADLLRTLLMRWWDKVGATRASLN
jgi:AcrR family transcriptional regulator